MSGYIFETQTSSTGFILRRVLTMFTRSGITPPKVNRFGENLEHSEHILGGWFWQLLGAIRAVASAGEPGEICIFCQVHNA